MQHGYPTANNGQYNKNPNKQFDNCRELRKQAELHVCLAWLETMVSHQMSRHMQEWQQDAGSGVLQVQLTIIHGRVEGADNQQRYPHVVKPPDELGHMPCAAAKEMTYC